MTENTEITLTQLIHLTYDGIIKKMNELNLDKLKEICRENEITGFSTLNKPELLKLITETYNAQRTLLERIKKTELLEICRIHKLVVDDCRGLSKDMLIHIIISATNIKNKIIKHAVILEPELKLTIKELIETKPAQETPSIPAKPSELDEAKTKLEELRREKEEQEKIIKTHEKLLEDKITKMKAEEKKREEKEKLRLEKEAKKEKLRLEKEVAEEKLRFEKETEEKRKITREKKELEESLLPPPYEETQPAAATSVRGVRKQLPASVRNSVWNHYIGEDINKHRCLCCKKVLIHNRQFDVGHVISVKEGGTDEINNLRPICAPCNHSMGSKNMIEFVKTYGYYIG